MKNLDLNTDEQLQDISENVNLCKALALMQNQGQDYFIAFGKAYVGTLDESSESYSESLGGQAEPNKSFEEYLQSYGEEVEEVDDEGEKGNYLVLTDEEATGRAYNDIKQCLWAFNAEFLSGYTNLPSSIFTALQPQCENANEAVEALIESAGDIEGFCEEAIRADGRGHFMSSYDGNEDEEEVNIWGDNDNANPTFFVYRMN